MIVGLPLIDKTVQFRKSRTNASKVYKRFAQPQGENVDIEMGNLSGRLLNSNTPGVSPPRGFMSELDDAKNDVFQIEDAISKLNRAQTRRLQVFFVTDASAERNLDLDVMQCSNEVVRTLKQCEKRLQYMQEQSAHETDSRLVTLHTNAIRCIGIQLNELYTKVRTTQKEYLQTLMNRNKDSGFDILNEENSGRAEVFGSLHQLKRPLKNQSNQTVNDLQERHREIQRVVQAVTEIHSLFEDVSRLVIEQGSMLDRIDVALETAATRAEGAQKELKKTEENQKNGLAKRISVFLLGMNVLMTCLLILKHWPS